MTNLRLVEIGCGNDEGVRPYEIIANSISLTDYAEDFLKEEGIVIEFGDLEEGITEYGQDYELVVAVVSYTVDGGSDRYEDGETYHFQATRLRFVGDGEL